ncbi:p-hydroxylaminobenzoate lyase [Xylariaceae sp. FL0804]|nr:p-hydroxylaminobenzoate lyase [Xylariaceae sp. FL0804]
MDSAPTQVGQSAVLDLSKYPTAQKLVDRCCEFFAEVEDLTPGKELEARLNRDYGPGNAYYDEFCALIREGLGEGWVGETEISGRKYRRGRIALPSAATRFFSITTVYMDSDEVFAGQYHAHPYGEINCVVQVDDEDRQGQGQGQGQGKNPELEGMQGWQGAGWTSPGPGTHHYPRVRGGAVVALFFLPAGRISYKATPDMPQPLSV